MAFLAVVLLAFAPFVRALCELEGAFSARPSVVAGDPASHDDCPGHDDESCCVAIDATAVESSKAWSASRASANEPIGLLHVRAADSMVRNSFVERVQARFAEPPPEPVMHRFPRLLI